MLTAEEITLNDNSGQSVGYESPSKFTQTFYDTGSSK